MINLIIGEGEIGEALYELIKEVHYAEMIGYHEKPLLGLAPDILHITFPYSENFVDEVERYKALHEPTHVVIHSTVPVGVCSQLKATHSPVVGKHPHLKESLLTFTKFVGGEDADEVADIFRFWGMNVQICRKSETTELAKLLSTMYYSLCIEFAKHAEKLCEQHNVPFSEAYTLWNESYNKGYKKMDMDNVVRPILQPLQKKQGGHCTIPNLDLIDSEFAEVLKNMI